MREERLRGEKKMKGEKVEGKRKRGKGNRVERKGIEGGKEKKQLSEEQERESKDDKR